ncbi:hypothetical protein JZ751_005865 [Albula glossodonta]|uniref:Uncharacterized protein n=1 Tax=Albula glossodonta TaxID=121402 RepID=A0A8T2PBP7_9TELE|nr:hypothetical protein JZ751_005865 [Albula glossodonta]
MEQELVLLWKKVVEKSCSFELAAQTAARARFLSLPSDSNLRQLNTALGYRGCHVPPVVSSARGAKRPVQTSVWDRTGGSFF